MRASESVHQLSPIQYLYHKIISYEIMVSEFSRKIQNFLLMVELMQVKVNVKIRCEIARKHCTERAFSCVTASSVDLPWTIRFVETCIYILTTGPLQRELIFECTSWEYSSTGNCNETRSSSFFNILKVRHVTSNQEIINTTVSVIWLVDV